MKKLIVVLLIAAAGCATPRAPEPASSAISQAPETVRVEPAPIPPLEKPAEIIIQPASPAPEPAPQASQPLAVKKEEPKHPPVEVRKPGEEAQPPIVASKQPETPLIEQTRKPSSELREKPVSDQRLQSLTTLADANDEKIMNVFVGMYRKTVETIMGSDRNPFRKTKIIGIDGDIYDVLFYLTREPRQGKPITDRMLFPVIFKKGRVVAMGNYQLKKLIRNGTLERRRPALSAK